MVRINSRVLYSPINRGLLNTIQHHNLQPRIPFHNTSKFRQSPPLKVLGIHSLIPRVSQGFKEEERRLHHHQPAIKERPSSSPPCCSRIGSLAFKDSRFCGFKIFMLFHMVYFDYAFNYSSEYLFVV